MTWTRPLRDKMFPLGGEEKSARGKNMYHVFEHVLVMFLHGRAMEGRPAELHYALPEDLALTAEAEPYWFDATTEHRVVGAAVDSLPGHRHVTVELSGLDQVPDPLFPPPEDAVAPVTRATLSPPVHPARVDTTPGCLRMSSWIPQKHPPARTAVSTVSFMASSLACAFLIETRDERGGRPRSPRALSGRRTHARGEASRRPKGYIGRSRDTVTLVCPGTYPSRSLSRIIAVLPAWVQV